MVGSFIASIVPQSSPRCGAAPVKQNYAELLTAGRPAGLTVFINNPVQETAEQPSTNTVFAPRSWLTNSYITIHIMFPRISSSPPLLLSTANWDARAVQHHLHYPEKLNLYAWLLFLPCAVCLPAADILAQCGCLTLVISPINIIGNSAARRGGMCEIARSTNCPACPPLSLVSSNSHTHLEER